MSRNNFLSFAQSVTEALAQNPAFEKLTGLAQNANLNKAVEMPLLAFATVRSAHYTVQYEMLNRISARIPGLKAPNYLADLAANEHVREEVVRLLKADVQNAVNGYYPITVFQPENPLRHARRMARIFLDGIGIYRRRATHEARKFSKQAREHFDGVPDYYKRNFHFQTDGYLSENSAELYEHQVELLFGGTANAMRRLLLKPMKEHFRDNPDGEGLTFLELGAGTGTATRNVRLAFPKARIVVTDLSEPYLRAARRNLEAFDRLDYVRADAADLPFAGEKFDAVYSVFTLHETPLEARKAILKEAARVLKKGGFLGVVDSAQLGDVPQIDDVLKNFPTNFHEPFYMNYIKTPLEKLLKTIRLKVGRSEVGLFSKVVWAVK
ncbi:MAG TPA: class I SAM-dependent methyltransferase [Bdellovibrionales bacterium]|nr:class I SAM-dependent methyltransferase [Bdellovibrionales bacterium]